MERKEFEALVGRMEAMERANPRAYRRRVLAWAAMGYGYLLLVVLGLLGISALLVWGLSTFTWVAAKLLLIIVPGLFVLLRALWVRFDPPEGHRLTEQEVPALFALLDGLRSKLKTPRIHVVLLTDELNAAVTQVPRLGFLGWHRNYLLLGLPLIKGLTVAQFTAVLAHELGHLSGGHARVSNWVYRLRQIWSRLDAEFSRRAQTGSGVIRNFFHWYSPRFNATSFPLARANEFEADAAAVRLTSPADAAQALTGLSVLSQFLDQKYWPSIHDQAKEQPQPSFAPYSNFVGNAVLAVPEPERQHWLSEALARTTSYVDTHPSLTDRLAAIGAEAEFAPPGSGQGAETLLGGSLAALERKFDGVWQKRIASSWLEFHEETRKARSSLNELRERATAGMLDEDSMLEWASVEERVGEGADRALTLRRQACARFPESLVARFVLGRQLLQSQDVEGMALMEAVAGKDAALDSPASRLMRDFLWNRGEKEQADLWHTRYVAAEERMAEARQERDELLTSDTYVPHGLSDEALERLVSQIKAVPHVRQAYLVRKLTRHFPEQHFYVLAFVCAGFFELKDKSKTSEALQELRTRVEFPGETTILSVERPNQKFRKLFKKVEGARVL
jgi:Zn-dependent protease with chaperone function